MVMQVQMPKFAKISSDFIGIYEKIAGSRGSAPYLIVTVVCLFLFIFKHRWRYLCCHHSRQDSPRELLSAYIQAVHERMARFMG